MINMQMIIKNAKIDQLEQYIQDNLLILLDKMTKLEEYYGEPLVVTSGLRTKEDQLRIYKAKNIPENKIPWGSQHLKGAAVDISDPSKELANWCHKNIDRLEELGLYCEDTSATLNWVHFQIYPPKSGNRFFKP